MFLLVERSDSELLHCWKLALVPYDSGHSYSINRLLGSINLWTIMEFPADCVLWPFILVESSRNRNLWARTSSISRSLSFSNWTTCWLFIVSRPTPTPRATCSYANLEAGSSVKSFLLRHFGERTMKTTSSDLLKFNLGLFKCSTC